MQTLQASLGQLSQEVLQRSLLASTLQDSGVQMDICLQRRAAIFKSSMGTWTEEDLQGTPLVQQIRDAQMRLPSQRSL